jgi:hypothetical protein
MYFYINFFIKYTSGWMSGFGSVHLLFKSRPIKDDLEFPIITPSTFIIGMSLIMKLFKRYSYFYELETNSLSIYFITKEE